MQEHRRSKRYPVRLVVDLHTRGGTKSLQTVDVSRHGIFLATTEPPVERHVVRLTLHTPSAAIPATAWVSRRVKEGVPEGSRGAGLQFFSLSTDAKKRWDDFIFQLQQRPRSPSQRIYDDAGSSFVVKLHSEEKLREFTNACIATGSTFMVTPVLHAIGTPVALHMVHPVTEEEFVILGHVSRVNPGRPKGIEITLDPMSRKLQERFRTFVQTGAPVDDEVSERRPMEKDDPFGQKEEPQDVSFDIDVVDAEKVAEEHTFDWNSVEDDQLIDLDIDDAVLLDFDEVTGEINIVPSDLEGFEAPPRTDPEHRGPPNSAEELADRMSPAIRVRIDCTTCNAVESELWVGPAPGILGLVADRHVYWCSECRVPRQGVTLNAARERQDRLEALGGPEGKALSLQVPLSFVFEVAQLSATPKCPQCKERLTSLRAVRLAEAIVEELRNPGESMSSDATCPACENGKWMITRID